MHVRQSGETIGLIAHRSPWVEFQPMNAVPLCVLRISLTLWLFLHTACSKKVVLYSFQVYPAKDSPPHILTLFMENVIEMRLFDWISKFQTVGHDCTYDVDEVEGSILVVRLYHLDIRGPGPFGGGQCHNLGWNDRTAGLKRTRIVTSGERPLLSMNNLKKSLRSIFTVIPI